MSVWDKTASEPAEMQAAEIPADVNVAIVGGGFTGLATALHCAEAGLGAHVLEAQHVGFGGSGRNVGLVNAGVWLPPGELRERMGAAQASRFLEVFGAAPQRVFDLIERHQIRCEPMRSGTIHAAHSARALKGLRARWEQWRALDAPVRLLDAGEVAERTGTKAFFGGLLDARAGTINPMGYCRGLARAAQAAGAGISEGVTVRGLRKDGSGWRVETDRGEMSARAVVLATNAYTDKLWPGLRESLSTIHYFQLATEPLGESAAHILPDGHGLWDTGPIMRSLRRDRSGRVMIGSMGRMIGTPDRGVSRRWADRQLGRLFPGLGPVRYEAGWHGAIAMTPDHLPRIHILDEGLFTPIGYNGRGITTGTVFGAAIAELLSGAHADSLPLPVSSPVAFRGFRVRERFYDLAFTANQVVRGITG